MLLTRVVLISNSNLITDEKRNVRRNYAMCSNLVTELSTSALHQTQEMRNAVISRLPPSHHPQAHSSVVHCS
jgi:hypothetical protein